jgi:hypothetical protein
VVFTTPTFDLYLGQPGRIGDEPDARHAIPAFGAPVLGRADFFPFACATPTAQAPVRHEVKDRT